MGLINWRRDLEGGGTLPVPPLMVWHVGGVSPISRRPAGKNECPLGKGPHTCREPRGAAAQRGADHRCD